MVRGKIIKNISDSYTVRVNDEDYVCKARGKFRQEKLIPLVGDEVEIDEKEKYIWKIDKRRNELKRPHISNVDIAIIVTSLVEPELALLLLDKQITSVVIAKVEPIICFTKLDLADKEKLQELEVLREYYENIGIRTFTNLEIEELMSYLETKFVVLTGQTGAGKSSLINKIDASFDLKVAPISKALGRGKHTTRHTEFHEVRGVYIADTPGFSAFDLTEYSKEEIREAFYEFRDVCCEYRDCSHVKEENCGVKELVKKGEIRQSRYDNYKVIVEGR